MPSHQLLGYESSQIIKRHVRKIVWLLYPRFAHALSVFGSVLVAVLDSTHDCFRSVSEEIQDSLMGYHGMKWNFKWVSAVFSGVFKGFQGHSRKFFGGFMVIEVCFKGFEVSFMRVSRGLSEILRGFGSISRVFRSFLWGYRGITRAL